MPDDGFRILVDHYWPRGLSKTRAHIDLWLKEIAPSGELCKWFKHDPAKWTEFLRRYRSELGLKKDVITRLKSELKEHEHVTFLFSAADEVHNNAVALRKITRL